MTKLTPADFAAALVMPLCLFMVQNARKEVLTFVEARTWQDALDQAARDLTVGFDRASLHPQTTATFVRLATVLA